MSAVARIRFTLGAACMLAFAAGCPSDPPPKPNLGPWDSLDERPCPKHNDLTFENFGEGFFTEYCNGCHSAEDEDRMEAPESANFETIEGVRDNADRMWEYAADDNDFMPFVDGENDAGAELPIPTEQERTMLGQWLACGAPTNADL